MRPRSALKPPTWDEIGASLAKPVSGRVAQRIAERALRKLRAALEEQGIDEAYFQSLLHAQDRARLQHEQAVFTELHRAADRVRDVEDPSLHESLHDMEPPTK